MVSFICFALVLAALVSAAVIFFKIGTVEVSGESRYSRQEIIDASGLETGRSMFLFNKFASISRIFAACPYIDTVQMRRTLPDRIEILVTPCRPTAVLLSEDGFYIIDDGGKILEKTDKSGASGLPQVTGGVLVAPEVGKRAEFFEEESAKALFSVLNTAKNNDILNDIDSVDITKVYDIQFEYMGRFTVRIGTADEIERKFKFVAAVIAALGDSERGVIDVSDGQTGYFSQGKVK